MSHTVKDPALASAGEEVMKAARASEEERRLLQDFAQNRDGTTAELVATHALCEDLERQRRQEEWQPAAHGPTKLLVLELPGSSHSRLVLPRSSAQRPSRPRTRA